MYPRRYSALELHMYGRYGAFSYRRKTSRACAWRIGVRRFPTIISIYPSRRQFRPRFALLIEALPLSRLVQDAAAGVLDLNSRDRMSALGGGFNGSLQHQVQSIGRAFEAQGLSRALVQPQGDLVEVGLGELREVRSFREVLP